MEAKISRGLMRCSSCDPKPMLSGASGSNHMLISDRLPDPAQLGAIEVVCEGSHSSRQKVTDITRRTVYLIQSGRKPRVSCQSPGVASTVRRTRVVSGAA